MRLVDQSYEILTPIKSKYDRFRIYEDIVDAGRTCYKSKAPNDEPEPGIDYEGFGEWLEERLNKDEVFLSKRIAEGHEAMLEQVDIRVKIVTNRAIANELVRHRLASYMQESTRYCNYSQEKFGSEITFVYSPYFQIGTSGFDAFVKSCEDAEKTYFDLLNIGYSPEQARDVLPLSVKTELIMKANLREWRHILKLRAAETTGRVHPMMKQLMKPLLMDFKTALPVIFDDIGKEGV